MCLEHIGSRKAHLNTRTYITSQFSKQTAWVNSDNQQRLSVHHTELYRLLKTSQTCPRRPLHHQCYYQPAMHNMWQGPSLNHTNTALVHRYSPSTNIWNRRCHPMSLFTSSQADLHSVHESSSSSGSIQPALCSTRQSVLTCCCSFWQRSSLLWTHTLRPSLTHLPASVLV